MFFAYLLRSEVSHAQTCIGLTTDLKRRLEKHNEGGSPHTAKFRPWPPVHYSAFDTREKAAAFEAYLKSGSGRAFGAKPSLKRPSNRPRPDSIAC